VAQDRIAWLARRVGSMSPAEIAFRLAEQASRLAGRWARRNWNDEAMAQQPLPVLPGLREALAALAPSPALLSEWRAWADLVQAGRLVLLGQAWPGLRTSERWHLDPVSGLAWPEERYCFDIEHRHAPGYGDVKFVWELNRLQYLQPVAALAVCTRDDELARFCATEIESWIDANPPFRGINWKSGIELALRVVSLLVVTSWIGDHAFSPAQRHKLWGSLAAHGAWLARFPSRFSSANNHCVAEAMGLFVLGSVSRSRPGWQRRAARARKVLETETLRQIHPDGVGAEQSASYTAFTLEMLLLCAVLAGRTGRGWPPDCLERMARAGEFVRWLTDAGGHQPRIGDDDGGGVFLRMGGESYISSILGCIAAFLDRPELVPPGLRPHLRQSLFGQPVGAPEPLAGVRCFPAGGYTVVREAVAGGVLVFDHGPLGYLSIAAHGHADALALWLHIGDRPVLIDAGTYLYHSGGGERSYFRGTPAHNTLSIAGTDSSQMTGPFNWGDKATAGLVALEDRPEAWSVEGEHDGFLRRFGVRHRRRLSRSGGAAIAVTDRLVGGVAPLPVEIGFLVAPDLQLEADGSGWTVADGARRLLTIAHDGPLSGTIEAGAVEPMRGWVSERFGAMRSCHRLTFRGELAPGQPSTVLLRLAV
jgi:hypothetical protein